jgi:hypothetical protein
MSGERNDVLAGGVTGVDQQSVGRPAVAAGDVVDHRPARPASLRRSVISIETITPSFGAAAI